MALYSLENLLDWKQITVMFSFHALFVSLYSLENLLDWKPKTALYFGLNVFYSLYSLENLLDWKHLSVMDCQRVAKLSLSTR